MSLAMHQRSPVQRSLSDRSKSPTRDPPPPRRRNSPRRGRSPAHCRSPVREKSPVHRRSPVREKSPVRRRSPVREKSPVRRRSPVREKSPTRRRSPVREKSPTRRRSPVRERSPTHRRGSPRAKSPVRTNSSHRIRSPPKVKLQERTKSPKHVRPRSPAKEKLPDRARSPRCERSRSPTEDKVREHARSPKHVKSWSPVRSDTSGSPSPRTKRLKRSQAEREAVKLMDKEEERGAIKERDKGRNKDWSEDRDVSSERRSTRDKSDGGTFRSSRRDRDSSISPAEHKHKSKYNSQSPLRASKAGGRDEIMRPRGSEQLQDSDRDSVAKMKTAEEALEAKQKQQPSFELSGKLAEETNRFRGVTLLFTEPPDARKPDVRWRLYVFKAGEVLNEPLYVHRQSCYLFGRERRVADIPTDHPSCSKQHAVIQFRLVEKEKPDGMMSKQVRPYLMDLGSTNGTFINDERVEPQRYYELFEKDVIKFGNSSREYVILHENSIK